MSSCWGYWEDGRSQEEVRSVMKGTVCENNRYDSVIILESKSTPFQMLRDRARGS